MKTALRVIIAACLALSSAGCGFKGDLVLPDDEKATPVETAETGATDVKKTDDR